MALEESKAPVKRARMRPECLGKVLESWKEDMTIEDYYELRKET